MNILATGITGLFGRYFFLANPDPAGNCVVGTSRTAHSVDFQGKVARHLAMPFDDFAGYREVLREFKPRVIINGGSEGNVDNVQRDPAAARRSNRDFPLFLLEEAAKLKATIVQFSSNAVYDGEHAPYNEQSPHNPLHLYGELKSEIDAEVRRFPGEWILLRPIVGYGWNFPFGRKNPVTLFLPMMREGKVIRLVDDQFENPIYAADVANILWRCIERGFTGELNLAGGDPGLSRYQWMCEVAGVFELREARLERATMNDFRSLTRRPRDTTFDTSKLSRELEYHPLTVREGAAAMKKDMP